LRLGLRGVFVSSLVHKFSIWIKMLMRIQGLIRGREFGLK
jgi:hypothetical protein